jgi:CRP/FNR family transcriptional regulator, anaerobic regulatory protein
MQSLLQYIRSHIPVSAELEQDIIRHTRYMEAPRRSLLHRQHQVAVNIYFIEKGAIRGYFVLPEGREVSCYFGFENNMVCAVDSYISGQPSMYNLEAMEDAVLYYISKQDLENLFSRYHEMEHFGRLLVQTEYLHLAFHYQTAQFLTAEQRYQLILQKYPHVIQRVPVKCLASFLGISQETLSRIRAKHPAGMQFSAEGFSIK